MSKNLGLNKIVRNSIVKLDKWLEKNGWEGYDPYDIRELPFLQRLQNCRILRRLISGLENLNPEFFRKVLRVEKKINAKGMGLFADAYLNLYNITGENNYKIKAKKIINWLDNNYSKGYSGKCWGYPFDWHSKIFIPKGTPSGVVTSVVGNAYWNFYKTTGEKRYLSVCKSICTFILSDLNIDEIDLDKICFSYTPLDKFHVNNANLFVAEFLIKVGKEINNIEFIEKGLKAVNYTLSQQNEDGSIFYWGKDQDNRCSIDHYHSGFEIRSLYSIWKLTKEKRIYKAVSGYYQFYLHNLFKNKAIPKLTPRRTNPIDIHSCAEAILCNSILSESFPDEQAYFRNSLNWTIKNMQHRHGWFIYMIINIKGIKWKIKIPYIRWGQAWMLNALSNALIILQNYNQRSTIKEFSDKS